MNVSGDGYEAPVRTVRIWGFAHGGDGLARPPDGPVLLVPGTVPGDLAEVRIDETARGLERGTLLRVLEAGPGRREPPCPEAGHCGGCQFQHVTDERQASAASELIADALRRGAKLDPAGIDIRPPLGLADPLGYRQRAAFHADLRAHPPRIGFLQRGTHDVHPPERCLVLLPELEELRRALITALPDVAQLLPEAARARLQVDLPAPGAGLLAVELEASRRPSDFLLERAAERFLACHESVRGVEVVARGPSGGCAVGTAGDPHVSFRRGTLAAPAALPGRLSPGGFLQASREGGLLLATTVLAALEEALGPLAGLEVLELFAGNGTLTLPIAAAGARVTAVESDAAAVGDLVDAAREASLPLLALHGEAARETERLVEAGHRFAAVVLDPPRIGAPDVMRLLPRAEPQAVIHVSCDAPTFARDAALLVAAGYVLQHVRPLLLFPQTAHFETVAAFMRGART